MGRLHERGNAGVIPIVLILAVIVGVLGTLLLLERRADQVRSVQGSLADAATIGQRLDSSISRWLSGEPDVDPPDGTSIATLGASATATFDALAVGANRDELLSVVTAYGAYEAVVSRATDLHRAGHEDAALALYTTLGVPAFDELSVLVERSADTLRSEAESAETFRSIGLLASFALVVFAVALIALRSRRQRRGLVAAGNHEAETQARRFISLMEGSSDLVTVLDRDARVTFQSASIRNVLGWSVSDVFGHDFREFLHPQDVQGFDALLARTEAQPGLRQVLEWRLRRADGGRLTMEAIVVPRFEDPDIQGILVNLRDISERIALEGTMHHRAFHDPLTGLANRTLFEDRLEHALDRGARNGLTVCVLLADLDDFKDINNTLGHASGDEALILVADRLASCVRTEDTLARVGGDAFAILVEETEANEGAVVAERIVSALSESIPLEGGEFFVHASIGIARGSRVSGSLSILSRGGASHLLVEADLAMQEAKLQARGRFSFYSSAMELGIVERMSMKSDLERGLAREEFVLHYQPIVSMASGAVRGAEALLRWQHPQRGLVSPLEFIPLAERTGMIIELGRWVLRAACARAVTWPHSVDGEPAPYVSVNVVGPQLQQPSFVDEVLEVLERSGLEASRLVLEMTESTLMADSDRNLEKIRYLQDAGVSLAIDDFGTGYSSLSYLRRFSMDILKIDRLFVERLGHDPMDSALVASMVGLGVNLGMKVIAEGIELREQLEDLRSLRCDLGQGFLFSKPVVAEAFEAMLTPKAVMLIPEALMLVPEATTAVAWPL
jgi:diguanylate cyclase (GGDEF)-like protein/PAS domain S-box-containing protein